MATTAGKPRPPRGPLKRWLLKGQLDQLEGAYEVPEEHHHKEHAWWQVMCLTGVDYFSTLGYQPGIAALAAGALSPLATLILILLTLFGALPIYNRVAKESPNGEGSIAMLEHLLTWWKGKIFVLVLLGFVATDFIITITLSAADATAHLVENPFFRSSLQGHQIVITLALITMLGAVFLKGFKEAIGLAVVLVAIYLVLNAVVIGYGIYRVAIGPHEVHDWWQRLTNTRGGNPVLLIGMALLLFPKLALGLSGFETGVAIMPLVKGDPNDPPGKPLKRIKNTKKLLRTAALLMSVFLLGSSFVTTVHIPLELFREATANAPAGPANGRALAYLAHSFFGDTFGTVYDFSTILILWFAGASAMAGLLNIVPRYLPRYGMAPEWTRAVRPLVLVYTLVAFAVTIIFKADVTAQGGAYATGVLVLMTSAAIAVSISAYRNDPRKKFYMFAAIAVVFAYTTFTNMVERPDGLKIASFFIVAIVLVSSISRIWRTLELRVDRIELDETALKFVQEAAAGDEMVRIIPNHPEERNATEYERQDREAREDHQIPDSEKLIFFEVYVPDASNFSEVMKVEGVECEGYRVLRAQATAIPNAIAAFLLYLRDHTGKRPHAYFNWTEGNPLTYLVKYVLTGQGETAPITREILRQSEPDHSKRPAIHAGN